MNLRHLTAAGTTGCEYNKWFLQADMALDFGLYLIQDGGLPKEKTALLPWALHLSRRLEIGSPGMRN